MAEAAEAPSLQETDASSAAGKGAAAVGSERESSPSRRDPAVDFMSPPFACLYIGCVTLSALTLTIFPGATLGMVVQVSPLLEMIASWGLEDLVRVVSVAVISWMPFVALKRARRLSAQLTYEHDYAEQAATQAGNLLDLASTALSKVTFDEFRRLFEMHGRGRNLLAEKLHDDVMWKAIERRVEPTAMVLSSYAEELTGRIGSITPFQRLSLQLGIFFTFVGLASAFSVAQMAGFASGRSNQIDYLLTSLSLAFGTSIAGLLSSMYIILFVGTLRGKLSATLRAYEAMVDRVYSLGRRLPTDERFLDQVGEVANEVKLTRNRLEVNTVRTDELTRAIEGAWERFTRTRADFDDMIGEFNRAQTQLIAGFQGYVGALRPELLAEQVKSTVRTQVVDLNRELTAATAALAASRERVEKLESAAVALAAVQVNAMTGLEEVRAKLSAIGADVRRLREADEGRRTPPGVGSIRQLWARRPWRRRGHRQASDGG